MVLAFMCGLSSLALSLCQDQALGGCADFFSALYSFCEHGAPVRVFLLTWFDKGSYRLRFPIEVRAHSVLNP